MAIDELRNRWRDQKEGWERLRWARTYWQATAGAVSASAEHAAESLQMKPGTYRAYERPPGQSKHTRLDDQSAMRFARKYKVNWRWLLLGEGTPFDDPQSKAQERVLLVMSSFSEEQQNALADMVETLFKPKNTGTDG